MRVSWRGYFPSPLLPHVRLFVAVVENQRGAVIAGRDATVRCLCVERRLQVFQQAGCPSYPVLWILQVPKLSTYGRRGLAGTMCSLGCSSSRIRWRDLTATFTCDYCSNIANENVDRLTVVLAVTAWTLATQYLGDTAAAFCSLCHAILPPITSWGMFVQRPSFSTVGAAVPCLSLIVVSYAPIIVCTSSKR